MSDIIVVTNRALCRENFLKRIEKIAAERPRAIILREKELSESEYEKLAVAVLRICSDYGAECILHSFSKVAENLGVKALHAPLFLLKEMTKSEREYFTSLGASCHSVSDVTKAESLGCSYVTAGHVFDTDCKKGLPGRGINFLKDVCDGASIPVFAIGGISPDNISQVRKCGAAGACVMSGAMICDDVGKYFSLFEENI